MNDFTTSEVSVRPGDETSSHKVHIKPLLLILGGVVGSVLGLIAHRLLYPIFEIPDEIKTLPDPPPLKLIERLESYQLWVDCLNYPILFGITGLLVGFLAAALIAWERKVQLVLPGFLGAIGGAVGAVLCSMMASRTRANSGSDINFLGIPIDAMMQGILGQIFIWGLMGLGIGAGIGLLLPRIYWIRGNQRSSSGVAEGIELSLPKRNSALQTMIAGLAGGSLGALLFVFGTAILAPTSSTNHVVPRAMSEQICQSLIPVLGIVGTIALALGKQK